MLDVLDISQAKHAWVERVLGISLDARPVPDLAAVRERLNELGLKLRDLAEHPDFAGLRARFGDATAALRANDAGTATKILDELEPIILGAISSARGDEIRGDGPSLSGVARASLAWRDACAHARSEIAALKARVMSDLQAEDDHDPEELGEISEALGELDTIMSKLDPALADLIDTAINEGGERRAASVKRAIDRVTKYEAEIKEDELIAIAQDNGAQAIDISGPALAALAKLRESLEPLVA